MKTENKKSFTFVVTSYNQEKVILENLESIKYQIENYGKDINCSLLICDDCSQDNTVEIVKRWLDINKDLFYEYKIMTSEKNMGTVKNTIRGIQNTKTDNFKILHADDLFYKNNIFEFMDSEYNFVVTPVIRINNQQTIVKDLKREYFAYIVNKNRVKKIMKKTIEYTMPFHTPGVVWKKYLFDQSTIDEMKPYNTIEDVPLWKGLLSKDETKVCFCVKPYVLYRTSIGVSHNLNNPKREQYNLEKAKLQNEIWWKNKKTIYRVYFYILARIYERIYFNFKEIQSINNDYKKETVKANEFYKMIQKRVEEYSSISI